ncbi:MAG: hypothetical protein WDZ57_01180 [Demequina sp.]
MKPYSDYLPHRTRQILVDLTAVGLIALWVWIGRWVYEQVEALTAFGVRMEESGAGFRRTMDDAGDSLGSVPLIGEGIRAPFDAASSAGAELEAAGQAQQDAFTALATGLGIAVAAGPIAGILLVWLVPRVIISIRAASARKWLATGAGMDLFAARALLHQRPRRLLKAHPDPAGAWRRDDADAIAALATLELRSLGVRPRTTRGLGPPQAPALE